MFGSVREQVGGCVRPPLVRVGAQCGGPRFPKLLVVVVAVAVAGEAFRQRFMEEAVPRPVGLLQPRDEKRRPRPGEEILDVHSAVGALERSRSRCPQLGWKPVALGVGEREQQFLDGARVRERLEERVEGIRDISRERPGDPPGERNRVRGELRDEEVAGGRSGELRYHPGVTRERGLPVGEEPPHVLPDIAALEVGRVVQAHRVLVAEPREEMLAAAGEDPPSALG